MLADTSLHTTNCQAKLFRGLADPSRLAILEALRQGSLHVSAIVAATGLSQSNVSNHLRCLSECGLVRAETRGRFVHYQLGDERIEQLLRLADELLTDTACGVRACGNYERASR
ncbi:ArsR/SmtB family transcription factor [Skermanella aerolata]|uniref:ArsR/SmtB family transcription factor n=1 Tax=Skermanella aerolata TaxID=393310 RepID=UPI003D2501B4